MSNSGRVSLLDAISEYYPTIDTERVLYMVFGTVGIVSFACSATLVCRTEGWSSIVASITSPSCFTQGSADCLLISIAQIVVLPLLAYSAVNSASSYSAAAMASITTGDIDANSTSVHRCQCFRCFYPVSSHIYNRVSLDRSSSVEVELVNSMHDVIVLEGYEDEERRRIADNRKFDELLMEGRKNMDQLLSIYLLVIFFISTSIQIYIGLKCISFSFKDEAKQSALMGLEVLWINVLTWTLREIIQKSTREDGILMPNLHPHRLHLYMALAGHWCDLCGQRIKAGTAFRCKLCDYDLCMDCYSKRDKFSLEGQLRGDKGVKKESDFSGDNYFLRALALVKEEWKYFSVALLSLMAYNMSTLLMPNIQGSILNSVVESDRDSFYKNIKAFIFISVCSGLLSGVQSLWFSVAARRISNNIRKKLFRGIIIQDVAFFDGNSSGQLTSRLTNDVSFMVTPIQSMLGTLVSNSILLVGGLVLCFMTSWRLSILAFTTVGPIVHITQLYSSWSQSLNRKIFSALAAANGYANEAIGNIRTVKSVSAERMEEEKYYEANDNALLAGIKDAFGGAGMYTINSYLELGAGCLILWYGGCLAIDGKDYMSPGKLITYQLYWNMLNSAYKSLLDIVTSFTRAAGAAQRVFSLMDSLPDIDIYAGRPLNRDEIIGNFDIRDVSYAYQMRPDIKVLRSLCLNIPAGTTCALVGKSGGGKSTLVNLMMRFYDPIEGNIFLDGAPLAELCLRDVRRQIGLVQQNTELFGGTIEENITYGLEPGSWTREDVIAAAKDACAHDFIKSFPEGYLTRVGERGVRISGGQKQRIAIARVFLRKPKILLLDEATSALDAESESKVQEALDRLIADSREKRTVVLVAHRLSTVINADQIAVIGNGNILERGSHEELLEKNGEYANLVRRQLKKRNAIFDMDNPMQIKGQDIAVNNNTTRHDDNDDDDEEESSLQET